MNQTARSPRIALAAALSVAVLGVAALVAACGGGGAGAPQSGSSAGEPSAQRHFDPCTVLTPAEIQSVVGGSVQPATQDSDNLHTYCHFQRGASGEVEIASYSGDLATVRRGATDLGERVQSVPGLGDDAVFQFGFAGTFLYVTKGGTPFIVQVAGPNATDEETRLARLVLARM